MLSWKITGLFQNFGYFSKCTVAVRTGTIAIIPVRYLSLRTLSIAKEQHSIKLGLPAMKL